MRSVSRASIIDLSGQTEKSTKETSWWQSITQGTRMTKSIFIPFWDQTTLLQIVLLFSGIFWMVLGISVYIADRQLSGRIFEYEKTGEHFEFFWPRKSSEMNIYYTIENFYSNHRIFVDSKPADIFLGSCAGMSTVHDFKRLFNNQVPQKYKPLIDTLDDLTHLWPCGAAAFTVFNDEFALDFYDSKQSLWLQVPINRDTKSILGDSEDYIHEKFVSAAKKAILHPIDVEKKQKNENRKKEEENGKKYGSETDDGKTLITRRLTPKTATREENREETKKADGVDIEKRQNWLTMAEFNQPNLYLWMKPQPTPSFKAIYGTVDLEAFKKTLNIENVVEAESEDEKDEENSLKFRIRITDSVFPSTMWDVTKGIQITEIGVLGSSLYKFGYCASFFGFCLLVAVFVLLYLRLTGFYSPAPSVVKFNLERKRQEASEVIGLVSEFRERGVLNNEEAKDMEKSIHNSLHNPHYSDENQSRIDSLNVKENKSQMLRRR